jgi:hypothetical protein
LKEDPDGDERKEHRVGAQRVGRDFPPADAQTPRQFCVGGRGRNVCIDGRAINDRFVSLLAH